jgi:uncharacterized protein (UPF0305 family)
MASVKEIIGKRQTSIPDTTCIQDQYEKQLFDAIVKSIDELRRRDVIAEFVEFSSTVEFRNIIYGYIESFIREKFTAEDFVRNVKIEDLTLKQEKKRIFTISPATVPGRREDVIVEGKEC